MVWHALGSGAPGQHRQTLLAVGERVYALASAWSAVHRSRRPLPACFDSVERIIGSWSDQAAPLQELAATLDAGGFEHLALDAPRLGAPFVPGRIFGAASNYIEHAEEMQTVLAAKAESSPYMFMKASTSVIGTLDTIRLPPEAERPDWEVELGVVIGRAGRRITVADAAAHIAGYTVVNDISARDMNRRSDYPFKHDWFRGKSWDTFCPLGPWFVPASCIAEPMKLRLWLSLNGRMMQDGNTAEMIFDIHEQIAYLSSILTLQPGDVIATGTPAGVGMGMDIYLKPGDLIRCGIDGIGELENPVAAEELP